MLCLRPWRSHFFIYTALLQREELKLQRKELEETRKELARSAISQEELVKLTKASYEFQKYVRKNEVWPEFSVSENGRYFEGHPMKFQFYLIPKYSPVRLLRALLVTRINSMRINEDLLRQFRDKIINTGESMPVQILLEKTEDLNGAKVHLLLSDVDGDNRYQQHVIFERSKLVITPAIDIQGHSIFDESVSG